ncbi:MAG: ATP-binding protein [Bacteroidota bacterium]
MSDYNPTNQLRQYRSIESNLIELQKQANLSRKRSQILFGKVAAKWRDIIRQEIHRIEQAGGLPLPNPFITGGRSPLVEKGEPFVGRQDIIRQIETEVLREGAPGAILFLGNRRTGKTSTLENLRHFLPSSLKTVFFSFQDPRILTANLPDLCGFLAKRWGEACGRPVAKMPADLGALTNQIEEWERHLEAQGSYLLVCFDEYERLSDRIADGTLRGLADAFRHWAQHFRRFVFLFAGSHEMAEIPSVDWTDYLINARTVRISYLEPEAALQLVTKPVPEFDLVYQPADLARQLTERMGRQPYLLQCTMFELVELLNNDGMRKTATAPDLDKAVERLFGSAEGYFTHFWKTELDDAGRKLLQQLAAEGRRISGDEGSALRKLVRREVLRQSSDGRWEFCVPVVREWVAQQ